MLRKALVAKIHALRLGRYKVWQTRTQSYLSIISFIMVLYLYITQVPLGIPWYVWVILIASLIPFLLLMDMAFVWPSEMAYGFGKNPKMTALEEKVNYNYEVLKQLKEKLL